MRLKQMVVGSIIIEMVIRERRWLRWEAKRQDQLSIHEHKRRERKRYIIDMKFLGESLGVCLQPANPLCFHHFPQNGII